MQETHLEPAAQLLPGWPTRVACAQSSHVTHSHPAIGSTLSRCMLELHRDLHI
jgi:hypothetical protein